MSIVKVICFVASWCQPCKSYKELMPRLCDELGIELEFSDVSESARLSSSYSVEGLPTLVFVDKEESEVTRIVGSYPEDRLRDKINNISDGDCVDVDPAVNIRILAADECEESL